MRLKGALIFNPPVNLMIGSGWPGLGGDSSYRASFMPSWLATKPRPR
ncbi:hypothetical protein JD76_03404 [Micromonospora endolithica]|nr:hypothetical protein JD76_03404 [Micromonospora endolithica]